MVYNVNKYKFDERTKEKFIEEMQKGLEREVQAIGVFKEILNNSRIENPEIIYVGSQEEGKIAYDGEDIANVDIFPDYLLKYKQNRSPKFKFIEVKICNPQSDFAYFKKKQIDQYIKLESVIILFVMGMATEQPKFILIRPKDILNLGLQAEKIYGKETYKADATLFDWEIFEPFERNYSVLYRQYIKEWY